MKKSSHLLKKKIKKNVYNRRRKTLLKDSNSSFLDSPFPLFQFLDGILSILKTANFNHLNNA